MIYMVVHYDLMVDPSSNVGIGVQDLYIHIYIYICIYIRIFLSIADVSAQLLGTMSTLLAIHATEWGAPTTFWQSVPGLSSQISCFKGEAETTCKWYPIIGWFNLNF